MKDGILIEYHRSGETLPEQYRADCLKYIKSQKGEICLLDYQGEETVVEFPAAIGTFCSCTSLKELTRPASVTHMDGVVFRGCEHLTIHAPAGSYAEQYAKETTSPLRRSEAAGALRMVKKSLEPRWF